MVDGNKLMNAMAMNGGNVVPSDSPVKNTSTVTALLEVKQLVLGNARILYGSEQRKFFDFVTGRSAGGRYICVLVCSLDGYTRILRKETNASPLEAARALADGLVSDAGDLFGKADVGDQLDACKTIHRFCGPADDTRTLRPEYRYDRNDAPRGPAADRKRHHRDGD